MKKFALLIDGGFWRIKFRKETRNAGPFAGRRQPPGGVDEDFGRTEAAQKHGEFLRGLRRLPFVAVRPGNAEFRGRRVKPPSNKNLREHADMCIEDSLADIMAQ